MKERVYFSVGSNQGDRLALVEAALAWLAGECGGLTASRIYETEPMHFRRQPAFLNVVATGWVARQPLPLLSDIKTMEGRLGRKKNRRYGPRPIDIDILLYGEKVINETVLTVPHPLLAERRFALLPLLELAPGLASPETGVPYWKMLDSARGGVYFYTCSRYTKRSLCPLENTHRVNLPV